MSIVISHVADANIYVFALNRILDTLIGIFIAIVINAIHIPHRKEQGLLFVCDLDHNLLSKKRRYQSTLKNSLKPFIKRRAPVFRLLRLIRLHPFFLIWNKCRLPCPWSY